MANSHKSNVPKIYHKLEYSCSVVWLGLNDMARRDTVREADGEAIMRHWKLDMPQYWTYNHNKYLIIGHRMLAGKYNHISYPLI